MNKDIDPNRIAVSTYDKIAGIYTDQYFDYESDYPFLDKMAADLPPKGKVLDVGCGPGNSTKYFLNKGLDVEGIDLSTEMIRIAKEKQPQGKFRVMDMRHIDYPDNTFDGLLAAYSLFHIPSDDTLATLKEFNRVLKENGILGLVTHPGESDKVVDETLMEGEKSFVNFMSKEELATFLKEAGFEATYQDELPLDDPGSFSDKVIYTLARKVNLVQSQ